MIFIFLLLPEMVNTFETDVFSIKKNVRNWIESQMEHFVWMFCFEVKIYKYSTKDLPSFTKKFHKMRGW